VRNRGESLAPAKPDRWDEHVRETVLAAVKRIINAEATASKARKPPVFTVLGEFPLTSNDEAATAKVIEVLKGRFGTDVQQGNPATASEDFSVCARTWKTPLVFWFVGGTDPQKYAQAEQAGLLTDLPSNHSPQFAPVLNPTLRIGIEAMLTAAGPWLGTDGPKG
jgi:metal-dependent amidase/aminoacylase/carboxypeptidase family protein